MCSRLRAIPCTSAAGVRSPSADPKRRDFMRRLPHTWPVNRIQMFDTGNITFFDRTYDGRGNIFVRLSAPHALSVKVCCFGRSVHAACLSFSHACGNKVYVVLFAYTFPYHIFSVVCRGARMFPCAGTGNAFGMFGGLRRSAHSLSQPQSR